METVVAAEGAPQCRCQADVLTRHDSQQDTMVCSICGNQVENVSSASASIRLRRRSQGIESVAHVADSGATSSEQDNLAADSARTGGFARRLRDNVQAARAVADPVPVQSDTAVRLALYRRIFRALAAYNAQVPAGVEAGDGGADEAQEEEEEAQDDREAHGMLSGAAMESMILSVLSGDTVVAGDYVLGDLAPLLARLSDLDRESKPHPLSARVLAALPPCVPEQHAGQTCTVCMEALIVKDGEEAQALLQLPICKHSFHEGCVRPWFDTHSQCPVCRHAMPTDSEEFNSQQGRDSVDSYLLKMSEVQGGR